MSTETRNKKYVELMNERSFGDMIGISFTFLFQEFKGLMLAILKYGGSILALAILLGVVLLKDTFSDTLQGSMFSQNQVTISFFIVWLVFMIGIQVIVATAYHYISVYKIHGKGNFTIKDVGEGLLMTVLKIFGGSFVLGLLSIPLVLLAAIPVIGPIIFFALFTYLSVNLSLFPFIIAHEKAGIGTAFSRSFKLIKGKWWFSFGLYVVFVIIIYLTIYAAMIPVIIVGFATPFIAGTSPAGMIVMIALFVVIIFFIYIMLITMMNILFGFQYFNMLVRKEGTNLTDRISAINNNIKQDGDIFEVKKEMFSDAITEQKEESQNEKKEETIAENIEEEPKTEDEWSKLLDDNEKKNRFEDGEDENDRFKPKF